MKMSKTERSLLSQNRQRDNKACNYNSLKSGFTGQAKDAVKAYYSHVSPGPSGSEAKNEEYQAGKGTFCVCVLVGRGTWGVYPWQKKELEERELDILKELK